MRSKSYDLFFRISSFVFVFVLFMSKAFCEERKVFPVSTEFQIGRIKPIVEKAPAGVYISVGSERSFRGASMAPHVTLVYLLDIAPEIIRFNRINIELLKAPTRKDYLHLRWEATYEDWKILNLKLEKEDFDWWNNHVRDLEKMNYPLPEALNRYQSYPDANKFLEIRHKLTAFYQAWKSKEDPWLPERDFIASITFEQIKDLGEKFQIPMTVTQEEWKWWVAYGRNKDNYCPEKWLKNPEQAVDLGQVVDYKTGNYIFDDQLYERLHQLALNNRLITMQIDLTDKTKLEEFVSLLKKEKAAISVLDLNNLYREGYIGDKNYKEIIRHLLPFGTDDSLLIVMDNYKEYACAEFQIYLGFTFENIRGWPQYFYLETFFATLPNDLLELMNGRVYEKDEMPPLHYLLGY